MRLNYCGGCGKEIHETAQACPHCGKIQQTFQSTDGSLWMPVTSMILGIISALALFDDSQWDNDTIAGAGILSAVGLVLGAVSLNKQKTGKGMAISGVVLSVMVLLVSTGTLSK